MLGPREARERLPRAVPAEPGQVRHQPRPDRRAVPQDGGLRVRGARLRQEQDLLLEQHDERDVPDHHGLPGEPATERLHASGGLQVVGRRQVPGVRRLRRLHRQGRGLEAVDRGRALRRQERRRGHRGQPHLGSVLRAHRQRRRRHWWHRRHRRHRRCRWQRRRGTGGTAGTGGSSGGGTGGGTGSGSCVGHCGSSSPVPGSSPACYCDSYCTQNNDCCADKVAACG
ncbi:MAG: hypothetical protein IPM35_35540 [Myxococcales bacterium]|nr:hypothetical protein [Myxococcales bacterium]